MQRRQEAGNPGEDHYFLTPLTFISIRNTFYIKINSSMRKTTTSRRTVPGRRFQRSTMFVIFSVCWTSRFLGLSIVERVPVTN